MDHLLHRVNSVLFCLLFSLIINSEAVKEPLPDYQAPELGGYRIISSLRTRETIFQSPTPFCPDKTQVQ